MRMDTENIPETLTGAIRYFGDADTCHEFLAGMRWPKGVRCPRCNSKKVGDLIKSRRIWNCKGCKKQFSVKVGTIFEDTKLPLRIWFGAIWLITNHPKGIASTTLAKMASPSRSGSLDIETSNYGGLRFL